MLKITVIAISNKMPAWVHQACEDYSKRFYNGIVIKLIEIPLLRRGNSSDLDRILVKEALQIKQALPSDAICIALDSRGKEFTSEKLAVRIEQLQLATSHVCFLIGGPEGLIPETLALCNESWSLSKLTLPHTMVRIVLFEALYRAWSIINNHPYHK